MKIFKLTLALAAAAVMALGVASCSDANEYDDAKTDNPAFGEEHPETLASTKWVRGTGIKVNAFGQDVQGYVESLDFVSEDSVAVKMSEPDFKTDASMWVNESNTEALPLYEYTYSNVTGRVEILKRIEDDKGKVSKTTIFTGVASTGSREIITVVHFGDIPEQTYLVRQ